ncbi:MAG: helix-turn-helix transcriptional regulator [Saprospiraceae bacterium]|nr:helix-turn-helix transcriptional regulator [Saprospiraceae bacterium]
MHFLHIKNMVCARCLRTVERIAGEAGLATKSIQLGKMELDASPEPKQLAIFRARLKDEGFELLDDRNSCLIEQMKALVIGEIHHAAGRRGAAINFSDFLASETLHEYGQLSRLFSAVEGVTIEKFVIAQKIERAKELLLYNELTLTEIADQIGYSSPQHLSSQFRQATGMTPSQFKSGHQQNGRKPLDGV